MFAARTDPKVSGYLGRALSLELSAVQQYSTQARLVAAWGLIDASASFGKEAEEELQHANRIIDCMLAIGVAPNASQLQPVKLAASLTGLLQLNQRMEKDIIQLYLSATRYCASMGDHDSRLFFGELLKEEQQHYAELEMWINRLLQQQPHYGNGR